MLQQLKNIYHYFKSLLALIWYRFPSNHLQIIGVTGTDGKTTTSTLLYHVLKASGQRVALISTVAAYIDDQEIDTGFHVTSPDAWSLQKLLNQINRSGINFVVLEVTSHGLDQHRFLGINFNIAILTNITHEHLDYHRTYQRYVAAKAKLFKHAQYSLLNKDDQSYPLILKHLNQSKTQIQTYSASDLPKYLTQIFPQPYNQLNAQGVRLTALRLGLSESVIKSAFASFTGVPGRMQSIPNQHNLRIFIDFAHTPNSLRQALLALKASCSKGKLIAVFGAAGLRDIAKRPLMGDIATKYADQVILTTEDPRVESAESIIYQIKQGVKTGHHKVISILDRQEAINYAITRLALPGDTIAILGKGHEKSMNLDGKSEVPWSDETAVKKALQIALN